MRRLRSAWSKRLLVAVMVVSLWPALLAPALQAGTPHAASTTYADWLRAQALGEADAAFESALSDAADVRARSFGAFLQAFYEAYREQATGASLADALALDAALPDAALLLHLQSRFLQLVGEAVLPRLVLGPASSSSAKVPARTPLLAISERGREAAEASSRVRAVPAQRLHPVPVRVRTAARPMGP